MTQQQANSAHAAAPVSDRELVKQVRAGKAEAFETLLERHQDKVFRLSLRMMSDPEEAADVTQDAFVRAYASLDKFRGEAQFSTWIFRIAANEATSRLRRRATPGGGAAPIDGWGDDDTGGGGVVDDLRVPRATKNPLDLSENSEAARVLQSAIDRLPDDHRAIIHMREVEELSYQDIAEILDVPIGTVRSKLFRARAERRGMVERYFFPEGTEPSRSTETSREA
jgi:RNA polymerase sigma-70 factor (ECF subfamily)